MPTRLIPKNYRNVTGIAAHSKAIGSAMFESTLERDFLTLLEFNPDIKSFEVQPVTINWKDCNGKSRKYTPDVLVSFGEQIKPQTVLYEVKYRSELKEKWQELRPKFKAGIRFAAQQHWKFKLITDVEIRTPLLDNIKFLMPFIRQGPASEEFMNVLDSTLCRLQKSTPKTLLTEIFTDEWNQAHLMPTLWYLIGTHQVGFESHKKLTMNSQIWSLHK